MAMNAGVPAAAAGHGALDAGRLLEFQPLVLPGNLNELPGGLSDPEVKGHRGSGMS